TYPAASPAGVEIMMSLPGIERVVQPEDVKWLYTSRKEWRQSMLHIAARNTDTRIERAVAANDERNKAYKDAFDLYEAMWRKGDGRAAHDIAFGLLHGWDGGPKSEHAARYWYALSYKHTTSQDSRQACHLLEKSLKQQRPDTLEFCGD
ncbi:MAG: hypothetical protein N2690_06690, partial [Rhodocyclaceae bacterium]|nr:hypothetical protein [Rhodocyclaceae bacterium]